MKSKGYSLDKTVLGRFGYLLVCNDLELLSKNPNLLLASLTIEASEEKILEIQKGVKK